jgi:hypothetical protein
VLTCIPLYSTLPTFRRASSLYYQCSCVIVLIMLQRFMADIAEAANPAKKKEPPSKKPPIKSPEKPKMPIGDPPTKTVPKRVTHRFITEHGRAITPLGLLRQSWIGNHRQAVKLREPAGSRMPFVFHAFLCDMTFLKIVNRVIVLTQDRRHDLQQRIF